MQKLKTLCAIVGAAAIIGTATPTLAEKFNIPDYDLKGAEEKTSYMAVTPWDQTVQINDPSDSEGLPVVTTKMYGVDRNKDGNKDLVYIEVDVQDLKFKTQNEQGKEEEVLLQKGYKVRQLVIDDDFDGYVERMLIDNVDKDGNNSADGEFDEEQYTLRISDLM